MLPNFARKLQNVSYINFKPKAIQVRTFWEYVNMMFNKPDYKRIQKLGPDRVCAEWVLRNGGSVVWIDGKKLADYNFLPPEEQGVPKLLEIDGSNSSISHYGFPHLSGCTMLKKIILHNSSYIDDRALSGLSHGQKTLVHLQVAKCPDVTDAGVKEIKILKRLEILVLFDLNGVRNLEECKQYLHTNLPQCKILGKIPTGYPLQGEKHGHMVFKLDGTNPVGIIIPTTQYSSW